MFIQTEDTPNPQSLKFLPDKEISSIIANYIDETQAQNSPLALALFEIKSVKSVFIGNDFITVTKKEEFEWPEIKAEILVAIMDFLISGQEAIIRPKSEQNENIEQKLQIEPSEEDSIVKEIKEILETRIRPSVMQDGGDIVFKEFKDGIVYVELQGSCAGCPSSTVTLKNGIENMLKYYIPEVIAVESI